MNTYTVVSWNINSIRVRMDLLRSILMAHHVDVMLLQETKVQNCDFPKEIIRNWGYYSVFKGEKSYNGVAILSKYPIKALNESLVDENLMCTLNSEKNEKKINISKEARYLACEINGILFANVYVINGQAVESPRYTDKLIFLQMLHEQLSKYIALDKKVCVGGDFNIAPTDFDVDDPEKWREKVLCTKSERLRLRGLKNIGFWDFADHINRPFENSACFHSNFLEKNHKDALEKSDFFTWWDYRKDSFSKNKGMRIDYIFLSHNLLDAFMGGTVLRWARTKERPSDHAPVLIKIAI